MVGVHLATRTLRLVRMAGRVVFRPLWVTPESSAVLKTGLPGLRQNERI